MEQQSKDPLHGKRLDAILEELVEYYQGFERLGEQINIKCFTDNPSINSSLKFLRKTPWARTKVENLYLFVLRQKKREEGKKIKAKKEDLSFFMPFIASFFHPPASRFTESFQKEYICTINRETTSRKKEKI
ncbi:Uncharacterized conserved protein [Chryseobacterium sp. RU33C]|nr:Uncharacterized conserved protein [Chryseobacterium sp. RU33C]